MYLVLVIQDIVPTSLRAAKLKHGWSSWLRILESNRGRPKWKAQQVRLAIRRVVCVREIVRVRVRVCIFGLLDNLQSIGSYSGG